MWQAKHGHDAGLEQQVSQILETADVDKEVIQELDALAKRISSIARLS